MVGVIVLSACNRSPSGSSTACTRKGERHGLHTRRDPPRQAETRPLRLPPRARSTPCSTRSRTSFETVWRERADPSDRVELLEGELKRYRELEQLLRTTLVSAERAAHELKDQAKREADSILAEAQSEARTITRQARSERETLAVEARRLRLLLHAALDALDEADDRRGAEPSRRSRREGGQERGGGVPDRRARRAYT